MFINLYAIVELPSTSSTKPDGFFFVPFLGHVCWISPLSSIYSSTGVELRFNTTQLTISIANSAFMPPSESLFAPTVKCSSFVVTPSSTGLTAVPSPRFYPARGFHFWFDAHDGLWSLGKIATSSTFYITLTRPRAPCAPLSALPPSLLNAAHCAYKGEIGEFLHLLFLLSLDCFSGLV